MINLSRYKKYLTPRNMLIGGVLLVAAYFFYSKYMKKDISNDLEGAGLSQKSGPSDKIFINIEPEGKPVQSNAYMILKGYFADKENQAMTVPQGYYYIFRDTGLASGYQFVYAGTLGQNVSNFRINVPTTFFQDGSYEVVVSDEPIPDHILGTGAFANPAYQGETTWKDSSNVIKNHLLGFNSAPQFPSPNRVISGDITPQPTLSNDLTFI